MFLIATNSVSFQVCYRSIQIFYFFSSKFWQFESWQEFFHFVQVVQFVNSYLQFLVFCLPAQLTLPVFFISSCRYMFLFRASFQPEAPPLVSLIGKICCDEFSLVFICECLNFCFIFERQFYWIESSWYTVLLFILGLCRPTVFWSQLFLMRNQL